MFALADAMRVDAMRVDAMRVDAVRVDAVRADAVRADAVRADEMRADEMRADAREPAYEWAGGFAGYDLRRVVRLGVHTTVDICVDKRPCCVVQWLRHTAASRVSQLLGQGRQTLLV